ncbi:hypothetical protein LINPERPRIM_LOCUS29276 [Linum perenne]
MARTQCKQSLMRRVALVFLLCVMALQSTEARLLSLTGWLYPTLPASVSASGSPLSVHMRLFAQPPTVMRASSSTSYRAKKG